MPAISIAGVEITRDTEGRYNLASLTKAATAQGIEKDIRPNEWLSLSSTVEMAEILITENPAFEPIVTTAGRYGGTFVDEILAVSYAGWISPRFQLAVNQAFIDLKSGKIGSPSIPTTAEAFAHAFRMLADAERIQAEQTAAIANVVERVEIVEQTTPLKAKPQNAETRSDARRRINRVHGLSEVIVDSVLDHAGYGIRPFAMVKNSHEDAQGSSFGIYWIRDITALFKRFVSECVPHSATMVRHPIISRPFKLAKGGAK